MEETEKKEIVFKYIVPDHVRDLYVNGAYGGLDMAGNIHMTLFNERHPLPEAVTHELRPDDAIGDVTQVAMGPDVIRLVQGSFIMNQRTALALRDWLNKKISLLEANTEGAPEGVTLQ